MPSSKKDYFRQWYIKNREKILKKRRRPIDEEKFNAYFESKVDKDYYKRR